MRRPTIATTQWIWIGGLVAVGWFIGGIVGAGAAIGGLALGLRRSPTAVAAAAFFALVAAAVCTLVEEPATGKGYSFDFGQDRTLAAVAGRVAGVLLLVAVVLAARRERSSAPEPPSPT